MDMDMGPRARPHTRPTLLSRAPARSYAFGLLLTVSSYRAGQQAALFVAMRPGGCGLHTLPSRLAA
eukprot:2811899-Prymnesium_polylepis.1